MVWEGVGSHMFDKTSIESGTPGVRQPAVAGAFYPADKNALVRDIHQFLDKVKLTENVSVPFKAMVVPHAGYIYSGQTAAFAYAQLAAARGIIRRVVILGPVHRVPVHGLALPGVDAFDTPLGRVELDKEAIARITGLRQVVVSPMAHAMEHSLEVQLPFLQTVLDDFKLVPLAVGDASPAEVAQVLELLWGGPETLIVVSSDLSHYLSYAAAQVMDGGTVQNILDMQTTLTHHQACGATPVNGLLLAARHYHLHPKVLHACNSGDTAGDRARVVGYAAFILTEEGGKHA